MNSAAPLPTYFSWLSPVFRPSSKEVEAYARLIFAHEGCSPEDLAEYRRQAELQLWIWRNENRRRTRLPRKTVRSETLLAAS